MDRQANQKIRDLINRHQYIGIIVGKHNNIDHVAAGLGLFLSLKQLGKNVVIATPSDVSSDTSSLSGVNHIKKSLGGEGGDLIIVVPYREGEIEKVSSELNGDYLHLIVKAGEKGIRFQEKDIVFKRSGNPLEVLFYIGVQKPGDISHLSSSELAKNSSIVNIDNSSENQNYGDVVIVSPNASSVSEQVADFLTLMDQEVTIDHDIAQNLLTGIIHATNDFKDSSTTSLAFEMAGILMKKGAKRISKPVVREEKKLESTFVPQQQQPKPQQQFRLIPRPQPVQPIQSVPQQPAPAPTSTPAPAPQTPPVYPVQKPQPVAQPIVSQPITQPTITQTTVTQPVANQPQPIKEQPMQNSQPIEPKQPEVVKQNPPADWLTPKVYKGSTEV